MNNKIVLITGATDGIGKITATELAKQGYHVIVHGRNEEKAQATVHEIKNKSGNTQVDYVLANLFSLPAVKKMVDEFKEKYHHLDILINNAGAVLDDTRREIDGIENTMALNVLAPFLLNQLLLPSLKQSSDGRIINMSSATHRQAKPDMDDLNLENVSSGQARYGISKLFVIWNSQHLATELQKQGINNITVNCSHPGAVATNFGQDSDNGFINNLIYKIALRFMPAPEKGAVTNIYLASSGDVKGVTGKFFNNKKQLEKPQDKEYTPEKEQQLWDYCMEIVAPYLK
ncbi:SDR family NAD(P)-dependent oxidoreductase [Weissella hellenica]|uniref:NAD(P)-dependent dehydrogenase, short-chain alcohol dehydrogenase family n=1 Tax=Weissella hellenica TaxID=46256 RepID=A0A4Y4G353_WEIHE|nr:SDR family NAD(P)-dependent oxidoreductase [Weissella hellenica]NKY67245.1 SDR family NAD(P)-dependent oxidoreductase [Weissella hellenica]GED36143.1 dehydrogenase [Weissella hellenica]SCC00042.1 NAD(P)-dependent dehydrogenase, short-chain alcohol dehydrogenase family [Weissella hellenica]